MTEQNIIKRSADKIRHSVSLKIFIIGVLILVLLIPAFMVRSVIEERRDRRSEVIEEISSKWGQSQTIAGPVLTIPFKEYIKDKDGKQISSINYMHFLPDEVAIDGDLLPEIRYRGIYEAVLYTANITLNGAFSYPNIKELNVPDKDIIWQGAFLSLGISDMRGIREKIIARVNDEPISIHPGIETNDVLESGVSARIDLDNFKDRLSFNYNVSLNGSEQINFTPVGELTRVRLSSDWSSPSFDGAFLPVERQIDAKGFNAKWKVLHLNRNFPQYWIGNKHYIYSASFGVKLFTPVDIYQKSMRTAKYAVMFIVFTFLAFFFAEIMNKKRIHPIQYLLIGFAIIIFYTLLISISEHINFDISYWISSLSVIFLITAYSKAILKNRYLSLTVFGILTMLYTYLYILLQLEDYALLLGSIGLFVILSAVMYMTRKINWYAVTFEDEQQTPVAD